MSAGIIVQLFIIGIGLSMDAFAVAVCQGLRMKKIQYSYAVCTAIFFGGFQALMPFIGWAVGRNFKDSIQQIDHWIAFVLLGIIGVNMIREGLKKDEEDIAGPGQIKINIPQLTLMAVATSIDALAVGVTFAFLDYPIIPAISLIGCTTFVLSFAGVCIGNFFGIKYKSKAEIAGGIILVLMGMKILIEHLNIF